MKSDHSNCLRLLCLLTLVIGCSSYVQENSSCRSNPNVCNAVEDSFCHKISDMCVCQNGASTYPMCDMNDGHPCKNCHKQREYCQENPGCCNVKCSRYEMCRNGKCECMYGKTRRNRCRRCMEVCGRRQVCRRSRRSGKYYCARKKPAKLQCELFCGNGSKCKKVRGVVRCTLCGPGHRLVDESCMREFSWSPWNSWSTCSATCGTSGKRHRQRVCGDPRECQGEFREESPCLGTLPSCCKQGTGKMITRDFHGNDPEGNRFDARCEGGCFQIYKIVHDCKVRGPRQEEIDKVKRICEGKSVCRFRPAPSFFGPRECNGIKKTWVTFGCNDGSLVHRHKDGRYG